MSKYLVVEEEECSSCEGTGLITHWQWAQYWEENPDGLSGEAFITWWGKHVRMNDYGTLDIPDENETCGNCLGSGLAREEVDLAEALAALGMVAK